jgi:hypothetical protein
MKELAGTEAIPFPLLVSTFLMNIFNKSAQIIGR